MNTKEGFIIFLFFLNIILIITAGIVYVLVATEKQVGLKCTTSLDKLYAYRDFFCPEQLNVDNANNDTNNITFPIDITYDSADQCRKNLGQNIKIPAIPHDVSVDTMHDLLKQKDNCSLTITSTNPKLLTNLDFISQRPMYNYINLSNISPDKTDLASRPYTCPTLN